MRYVPILLVALLPLSFLGCDEDEDSDDGSDDTGPDGDSGDGDAGGAGSATGGRSGSEREFTDLPGKIRFANFISDGVAGVNLDIYWGLDFEDSEKIDTVEYGEVTEFVVPRRVDFPLLDEDEARYFAVPEGNTTELISEFLANQDQHFAEDTRLTVAFAGVENFIDDALRISSTLLHEHELTVPPAGMSHVYVWSNPFDQITDGDFVVAGADGLCNPAVGDGGGFNAGSPALIPAGSTGLTLFDANTEPACASGLAPVTESPLEGHSYVLIGSAESFELSARQAVLLEVGTEN